MADFASASSVTPFRGVLKFFDKIGLFDVVLPFLLVFTIVFALLEKTRVFGTEKYGNEEVSKKNLNSLAAFVIAFFVIASSKLVELITQISANVVLLVLASTLFILLAGSFSEQKEKGYFLEGGFKATFMVIMFVGLLAIFLNAIKIGDNSLLEIGLFFIGQFFENVGVASIVLVLAVVGIMIYVTRGKAEHHGAEEKK